MKEITGEWEVEMSVTGDFYPYLGARGVPMAESGDASFGEEVAVKTMVSSQNSALQDSFSAEFPEFAEFEEETEAKTNIIGTIINLLKKLF